MVRSRGNGGVIGAKITPSGTSAPGVWNNVDSIPNLLTGSWPTALSLAAGYTAYLDFGLTSSYPGSGTTVTDLSSTASNATISGTPAFTSAGLASYFTFTNNDAQYITSASAQAYVDFTIVFYPDLTTSGLRALLANSTSGTGSDHSIRFNTTVGSWPSTNPGNSNDWAQTATTYYLNTVGYTNSNFSITSAGWYILGGAKTNTGFGATWNYYLGAGGFSNRNMAGRIAAMVLYNRTLSAAEQKQNYNYFAPRFSLAPVA